MTLGGLNLGRPALGRPALGRLHVITPGNLTVDDLGAVEAVLRAGAPAIQVRCKGATDRTFLELAREVRDRCRTSGASCIIDDRTDIALAVGADGVHVGSDDLPVAVVREVMGPGALVGATCRNPDAARRAEQAGASYVGAGPVYSSSTKHGLPPAMGPAGIEAIATAISIPVIAISGVTIDHVPELLRAGAHGIAVIAAVFDAADPQSATTDFLASLGESTKPEPPRPRTVGAVDP